MGVCGKTASDNVSPCWCLTGSATAWMYTSLLLHLAANQSFAFNLFQALVVYECLSEWGQILCAICPNPKLVITGGTSTAICVWETGMSKERAKSLTLKQVNKTMTRSVSSTHNKRYFSRCICLIALNFINHFILLLFFLFLCNFELCYTNMLLLTNCPANIILRFYSRRYWVTRTP